MTTNRNALVTTRNAIQTPRNALQLSSNANQTNQNALTAIITTPDIIHSDMETTQRAM